MASGTTFGNLRVTITADTQKFNKGITSAQKSLTSFAKTAQSINTKLGKALTIFSATAAAGMAAGFVKTARAIDEIAKSAKNLNIATESLIGLRHAAQLSGLTNDQLETGLKRYTRAVNEARQGTESYKEAFDAIGLSANELMGMRLDKQLMAVADAMNMVGNSTEKVALQQELFGRAGAEWGVLLQQGSEGISKMVKDAEQLGMMITGAEAERLEKFNDELTRLKAAAGAAWQGFVIDIAPAATEAIESLTALMQSAKEIGGGIKKYTGYNWLKKQYMDRYYTPLMDRHVPRMLQPQAELLGRAMGPAEQRFSRIRGQQIASEMAERAKVIAQKENTKAIQKQTELWEKEGISPGQPVADAFWIAPGSVKTADEYVTATIQK